MNQKHKPFTLLFSSNTASYCTMHNEPAMRIELGENYLVISKDEVMRFFGLVPAPEPVKPVHADLIKAFAEGAIIEYLTWGSDNWRVLDESNATALSAFMTYKPDPKIEPDWQFRIKPQ